MTSDSYKYLLIGLFSIVVIGSFYLVFKNGLKLEKRDKTKSYFKSEKQINNDLKEDLRLDVIFFVILGLLILYSTKCST